MKISEIHREAVERLRINEGQLPWLPRNPRSWTQTDIDRMVRSVEEDPDFASVRPVLAVPGPDGTLVVFAHNLLTRAAQVRGDRDLPVAVFEPETEEDQETIRRLALKDNGSFGSWDTDILANQWDAEPWQLEEWGVPEWITGGAGKDAGGPDQYGESFKLPDGGKPNFCTMSFQVSTEQRDMIEDAIKAAQSSDLFAQMETYGNKNRNGNALALIVSSYGKM